MLPKFVNEDDQVLYQICDDGVTIHLAQATVPRGFVPTCGAGSVSYLTWNAENIDIFDATKVIWCEECWTKTYEVRNQTRVGALTRT